MAYRRSPLAPNEYYHVFNRGNNKQLIFPFFEDYARMLFCILHFQSELSFDKISRSIAHFKTGGQFPEIDLKNFNAHRYVELINFCLMPNHFHLILKEISEGGISKYMQRVLNSYTKYMNIKYPKNNIGHLFQGPFKNTHQTTNEQLLYLSSYIHRNPRELKNWRNKEIAYPWSSFQDCANKNRWKTLLEPSIILDQFNTPKDYRAFIDSSPAKEEHILFTDEIIGDEMGWY